MHQELSLKSLFRLTTKFSILPEDSYLACGGTIDDEFYPVLLHVAPWPPRITTVNNLKYFVNKVKISSCEEALSFVRLLTTPRMSAYFDNHLGWEVLIKEHFNTDAWLGGDLDMRNYHSGYMGVISEKDAERIGFLPAECTKSSTYRTERCVFQFDRRGLIETKHKTRGNLIRIQEEVTSSGRYRILNKTIYKGNKSKIVWDYPVII